MRLKEEIARELCLLNNLNPEDSYEGKLGWQLFEVEAFVAMNLVISKCVQVARRDDLQGVNNVGEAIAQAILQIGDEQ
jgi:hypothetical protein